MAGGLESHVKVTYLPDNLIVLQYSPSDIDSIIFPICFWHVLIDVGIYTGHTCRNPLLHAHEQRQSKILKQVILHI